MTIGIYAGSFDPFTYGHASIVRKASCMFEHIIIAVGNNKHKQCIFTPYERINIAGSHIAFDIENKLYAKSDISYDIFNGLLVDFCREIKDSKHDKVVIVRGLRAISDFESELAIADANSRMAFDIPTVFIAADPDKAFISSTIVKELALYDAPLNDYVMHDVGVQLKMKLHTE